MRFIKLLTAGVLLLAVPAFAFQYTIDDFNVQKNGNTLLDDSFDGSTTPPNAPTLSDGSTGSYATHGTFTQPSGGKLLLPTSGTEISSANPNYVAIGATLKTDTDASNLKKGLKPGQTFSVSGTYDLLLPSIRSEAYVVQLHDGDATSDCTECIRLGVRRKPEDGQTYITLWTVDFTRSPNVRNFIAFVPVEANHQQIRLKLAKNDAAQNTVTASFSYVDNGSIGAETVVGTAPIFSNRGFTRARFAAFTPIASYELSGNLDKQTISLSLQSSGTYAGQNGNVYMAAFWNGYTFFNDGSTWRLWQGGAVPAYQQNVPLIDRKIPLFTDADLRALVGATLIVGYGLDASDMLNRQAYSVVYTIQ